MKNIIDNEYYTLFWTFRNDHVYNKAFETKLAAMEFVHRCGLVSHPDIIAVKMQGYGEELNFKLV